MSRRGGSNALDDLKGSWSRWTGIVELFARRRRARRSVDPQAYAALHNELIEACRSIGSMVDEQDRAYFSNLEHLVLPWVTTKSFVAADREILGDLLSHCKQVDRELSGRTWSLPDWRRPARLLSKLTIAAGILFLFWTAGQALVPIVDQGRTLSES